MAIQKKQIVKSDPDEARRYLIIGVLVVVAFFGAYRFSATSRANASTQTAGGIATPATASGASANGGGGCCGGGGASSAPVAGAATVQGGVQKVTIDLTTGSYSPNQITAKAGIPLELNFKGPASGCNGQVVSQDLGFQQDVSQGGTIKVGALKPGTYTFTCSMGMYTGHIIVK